MGVADSWTVAHLAEALERLVGAEQAAFFREAHECPASRHRDNSTSRQARHARVARMTNLAVAACPLLAIEQQSFRDFTLSPQFGRLFPYSMAVYGRYEFVTANLLPPGEPRAWELLWRAAADSLLDASATPELNEEAALRAEAAIAVMYGALLAFGEAFARPMRTAWNKAKRRGLLGRSPFLRMQLSLMYTFVGHFDAHLRWLSEPGFMPLELADVCCFVRRDLTDHRVRTLTRCLADRIERLEEAYYPPRPVSTLCRVVDYACTCMRNPGHFHTPSLALMVLQWIAEVRRELERMRGQGINANDLRALDQSLQRYQRVQVMEKQRFWAMADRLPAKESSRLVALW